MNLLGKETVESWKSAPKKNDKPLYAIVQDMGMDFKAVSKDLAKMAGIKEYHGTAPQNIEIRRQILAWELMPIKDLKTASKVFSPEKQKMLFQFVGKNITIGQMNTYIASLSPDKVKILENLKNTEFVWFLRQEIKKVIAHVDQSKANGNTDEINVTVAERTASIIEVNNMEKDLQLFLQKNDMSYDKLLQEGDIENKRNKNEFSGLRRKFLEKNKNNENAAKKDLEVALMIAEINKNQSLNQQQEFKKIASNVYEYNAWIWIDLKAVWWEELYANVQTRYIEKNNYQKQVDTYSVSSWSLDQLQNIQNNEIIKENIQIKNLVQENDKDEGYYTNLRKLYPEVDRLIVQDKDIQALMKIKSPTEKEKMTLENKLKEKTASSEWQLMSDTNEVIQQQAVTTCLDTLKMYMDINLSEQENVLNQFTLIGQKDLIEKKGEDVILDINGTINGKKMKLYYNLNTWTLQQEEFLSRNAINTPFSINDPVSGKRDVANMQLPKFQDFIAWAGNIDYKNIMNASKSLDGYKKNVADELKLHIKWSNVWNSGTEKDIFEKKILKDIAAQELFAFMGKNNDMQSETVSREENPVIYDMYSLMETSLDYYTIDELKTFRKDISLLTTKKEWYLENLKAKGNNQEKYLVGLVGNPKILMDKEFQKDKNSYVLFFSVFQTKESNIPIIDLKSLWNFITKSELVENKDISYLPTSEMQMNFNNAISEMEDNMSLASLYQDIENLPGNKKSV